TVPVSVLVGAQQFVGNAMSLKHAGRTVRMISLRRYRQAKRPIPASKSTRLAKPCQFSNGLIVPFHDHTGRFAAGVLLNLDGLDRGWRVASDAGAPQSFGVRAGHERQRVAPESPNGADEDRVVRSRLIEFVPCGPALLSEALRHVPIIGWIANRHRHDPF